MAVSIVVSPARYDDGDDTGRLYDALRGVDLTDRDRTWLAWLSGWGPETVDEFVSLLQRRSLASADGSTPGGRRTAHYVYDCPHPRGFSEEAAAGLPSFMSVGEDEDGPFFYCAIHRQKHIGLADLRHERQMAADHVATFHSPQGGAR